VRSRLLKGLVFGSSLLLAVLAPRMAAAQVQVTPNFSVTPTKTVTPWIYQMAIGALILGALAILGVLASYLRFAPRFFARKEAPPKPVPGARPSLLSRPPTLTPPAARPTAGTSAAPSAVAVAERPAPVAAPAVQAARAEAAPAPTAGPESEPAVQADAVGEAEVAAPEPRPSAKTPEEIGAPAEAATPAATEPAAAPAAEAAAEPSPATAPAAESAAEPAPKAAEPAPPAPSTGHAPSLDQETFDRVLEEQLGKGVDRRVAEGRARAAAVVAARKKAQG